MKHYLLFLSMLIALPLLNAQAATSDLIGIMLSNSCETMIIHNLTTACPTYKELEQLDSSLKQNGSFGYVDSFYKRLPSEYSNSWRLYDYDSTQRVIVDPVLSMHNKIRMIEIQPSLENYLVAGDMIENNTRKVYHDRYVDNNCRNAIISAEKWTELIADTIYYMNKKCNENHTLFNPVEIIEMPISSQDIATSKKYIHDTWLANIKEHCIYKFKSCS